MRDRATHISLYDRGRDTLTPLVTDTGTDQNPVWAPDGHWLAFAGSSGGTTANVYAQRVDGISKPVRMTESPRLQQPASWHPSGRFIAFEETNPHTGRDVMILPIEGDSVSGWRAGTPTVFVNGPEPEFDPMFSPDGRWLAYVGGEPGNEEVYVRPFPGPGGRWLVGAGVNPTWSRSKSELFYGVNGQIMVTTYAADGGSFHAEKARLWSEARYQRRGIRRMFDLHPDGERFALAPAMPASNGSSPDTITMIQNFSDELRRVATTP
jgi:Tol biopolymer transport system component